MWNVRGGCALMSVPLSLKTFSPAHPVAKWGSRAQMHQRCTLGGGGGGSLLSQQSFGATSLKATYSLVQRSGSRKQNCWGGSGVVRVWTTGGWGESKVVRSADSWKGGGEVGREAGREGGKEKTSMDLKGKTGRG